MLVIIGLVVGGVLVGQDLIAESKIRAQITDMEKVNQAVNAFRLKYYCLPGDCVNATTYFTSGSQPEQVTNGGGDGTVCGGFSGSGPNNCFTYFQFSYYHGTWGGYEWWYAFDHLAAAQMVNHGQYDETTTASGVPGVAFPKLRLNPTGGLVFGYETGYLYRKAGHVFRLGLCNRAAWGTDQFSVYCNISPNQARNIDEKLDDGKPYTGTTVAASSDYFSYIYGDAFYDTTPGCATGATNTYLSSNELNLCAPAIRASF